MTPDQLKAAMTELGLSTAALPRPRMLPGMTADQFTDARKRLGWTQARLAQELDITLSAVWRMEKGRRPISRRTELAMKWLARKAK